MFLGIAICYMLRLKSRYSAGRNLRRDPDSYPQRYELRDGMGDVRWDVREGRRRRSQMYNELRSKWGNKNAISFICLAGPLFFFLFNDISGWSSSRSCFITNSYSIKQNNILMLASCVMSW